MYTNSCGQVTILITIAVAIQTLTDFRGLFFYASSLVLLSESDSTTEVLMARIGALCNLLATVNLSSLDNSPSRKDGAHCLAVQVVGAAALQHGIPSSQEKKASAFSVSFPAVSRVYNVQWLGGGWIYPIAVLKYPEPFSPPDLLLWQYGLPDPSWE